MLPYQRPVVPRGYIARSVKPSKAIVTLPQPGQEQPTFALVEKLQAKIDRLHNEKLALEDLNAAIAAQRDRLIAGKR